MNQVQKLIEELCPEGVEHISITEAAKYVRGLTYSKDKESATGSIKVLRSNNINQSQNVLELTGVKTLDHSVKVRAEQKLWKGDILMSAASGSRLHVGKVAYIWEDMDFYFGGFMAVWRTSKKLLPRFLFHILTSSDFSSYLDTAISSSTINNLSESVLKAYLVPAPPIEVQKEIVRILDTFTELEAELETELRARERQFDFYRDSLLTFADVAISRKLCISSLANRIASGSNKVRAATGAFPVFGSTGVIGYSDSPAYSGEVLLVARVGANAGKVNAASGEFDVSDNTLVISPNEEWDVRFAFHQLTHMNLNQYAVGGGQPLITGGLLKNLEVTVPPLQEQKRIASILDRFNALINDPSEGLRAELTSRGKQFQYYRDILLNFDELEFA